MALSLIRAMSQLMLRSGSMRPLTLVLLSQIQDPVILRELPRSVGSSASAATMTVPCFATCSPCFRSCSQSLKGRRPMSQRRFEVHWATPPIHSSRACSQQQGVASRLLRKK